MSLPSLRRWWWLPLLAPWLLFVWGPALVGPFQFDDWNVIVDYSAVHSLAAWLDAQPGIRPLLKLSYTLNWMLSPEPAGFHLANLALHGINALLLLAWLRRLVPHAERDAKRIHAWTALAVLLWFLHPATTEAVTYISGRSVSLCASFMLAALLVQAGDAPRAGLRAALFTALALAVRETAWVLPLLLLLTERLRGRCWRAGLRRVAPSLVVVAVAVLCFLVDASHQRMLATAFAARDPGAQLWTQVEAWRWLAGQALCLQAPNIDPDIAVRSRATPGLAAQLALAAVVLLVAGWRVVVARSLAGAAVLWFALLLLPGNGFVPRLDVANDRHLYLPLLAPVALLVLVMAHVDLRFAGAVDGRWRVAARIAVVVLLVFLSGMKTLARNLDYESEVALWQRTVQQSPQKSRAWNNLGVACRKSGDVACARAAFERAVLLDPEDSRAANNLYFLVPR